jgi:hypothetical protein
MNRYMDGWRAEEAVLYALEIKNASLDEFAKCLNSQNETEHDIQGNPTHDKNNLLSNEYEKLTKANELFEALLENIKIALDWHHFSELAEQCHLGFLLPEEILDSQPSLRTLIELYGYEEGQVLRDIRIKKSSFANWLLQIDEKEAAKKVNPHVEEACSKSSIFDELRAVDEQSGIETTPWMEVQLRAKNELYAPDRKVDPKKELAVERIKQIATELGISNPSHNIASAIFTIIKPDDHDPKKRKG